MKQQQPNRGDWAIIALFTFLALIHLGFRFGWIPGGCRWFVAIPTLFATIVAASHIRKGGLFIPLALAASTIGDYFGSVDNFILQVAFFAFAHIFYICDFAPRRRFTRGRGVGAALLSVVAVVYLTFIEMHIDSTAESIAVGVYGAIILAMGVTVITRDRQSRNIYIVAALLFILSDSLIVFGKYIAPIPCGGLFVMTTYYAAQGVFMLLHRHRLTPRD